MLNFENNHVNRGPSDHSAFRITLGKPTSLPRREYIKQESKHELAFIQQVLKAFTSAADNVAAPLQQVFDMLGKDIHKAWVNNCKTSKAGFNPTPWWTPECTAAKEVMDLWNCQPLDPNPNSLEHANRRQDFKEYKRVLQNTQHTHFLNKIKVMSASKRPWEGMRWIWPRKPPAYASIKGPDGQNIKSITHLFNHMHTHFNSTASSSAIDWDLIGEFDSFECRETPPISVAEIMAALKNTSNTLAPGKDHLTWHHLKLMFTDGVEDTSALNALCSLFNCILDSGIWPAQFKDAISSIIPKPKKDQYDVPKAFRPIALLNTTGKLFMKILAKRIQFDGIAHDLFHPGQFGGIT